MSNRATLTASPYAAVFIDFENVYYFLKNHFHDPPDLNDYVLNIVRSLREKLATQGLDCLVMNAYADFERLATAPQGALYLMGVSTRNVLGTDHKNAADMQLCIDALEVHYTRSEIGTFILVAGDRDYIPVLQHLRRQARQVLVAGFRESVSGDLIQNLGIQNFIDARELLGDDTVTLLEKRRTDRTAQAEESRRLREHGTVGVSTAAAAAARANAPDLPTGPDSDVAAKVAHVGSAPAAPVFRPVLPAAPRPHPAPGRRAAHFLPHPPPGPRHRAPHLGLHSQRVSKAGAKAAAPRGRAVARPLHAPAHRRAARATRLGAPRLINKLRDAGTVSIEKRDGEPHPFSVIVVNYNHPDVHELIPGEE